MKAFDEDMIVAIEGVSYSGKSTLIDSLCAHGGELMFTTVANGVHGFDDSVRQVIHEYGQTLSPEEEIMLFAARLANKAKRVSEYGINQPILLLDRFDVSLIVLGHHLRGLPLQEVSRIAQMAVGNVLPDAYIFLDVETDDFRRRFEKDHATHPIREGLAHHDRMKKGFDACFRKLNGRKIQINTSWSTTEVCIEQSLNFIMQL
ncbi:dTMP kinase [Mucilaginibacter psychrotolerans]|uniref:Thymidylate kinase-like domain-containing protein n=1 Tax=Mucilaginibacter psychrotolerans TaxID=1524096 RepID=A0A4Y8S7Y4_9SPHI|nr:hypothetical protein [Mucilaginibacter psychrotolerans]TFF34577.1 hypothetical protein E2R66_21755 [Mucilaginibacter psychrotolerans]